MARKISKPRGRQPGPALPGTAGKAGKSSAAGRVVPRTDAKPRSRLAQEIVIEGVPVSAATGAQAIAPDHVPRSDAGAVPHIASSAPGPVPVIPVIPVIDAWREIEQFLYRQSELLDGKRWQDYIDLFADDGLYWMPVTPDQTDWDSSPSIFAEDKNMMEVRMGRVTHPTAWSQQPMWATSHVIGNVVVERESEGEYSVRSRFHMMELRRDDVRHFGGTYHHTLVRQGGQLKIKLQRVDMFNAQAPYDYVLQVWV
jgi:3-phenylpropionate/cinnamic acid dioxygenase small subunit